MLRAGTVFHTGDWKFDEAPMLGDPTDYDALKALGNEGVLAVVGDSTNARHEVSGLANVIFLFDRFFV